MRNIANHNNHGVSAVIAKRRRPVTGGGGGGNGQLSGCLNNANFFVQLFKYAMESTKMH